MDPVRTEIMRNRFAAMAEEAATVAFRTAHTTFVKQTQDFQVALARPEGEFFAYPVLSGVTSSCGQSIAGFLRAFAADPPAPGDVLISNDPFGSGGLATHTMDIHLVMPIFEGDELVCFAWSFVHASDIGGAVPGSISPDLTEIYQEGIRIRPAKLYRRGVASPDIANILRDNSRIGDDVWGDLEAMLAAMRLLERRLLELIARVGLAELRAGIDEVMDYAALKAREVIGKLTDGSYVFSDYVEGATADEAIHLRSRLTVADGSAEVDFAGSDPQVQAAFNVHTGAATHPMLCLGLIHYILTMEPSIPMNGGLMRPIRTRAPAGSLVNADMPAAMGNRWVTAMRGYDTQIGCLNQAVPGGLAACGAGQAGIISVAWTDPRSGRGRVAVVEPFSGGSGGRVRAEGVDGNDTMIGFLKSTPIEHVEVETPLIVRRHELVADSFGHGRHRGGAAIRIELECRAPEARITVRGLDRFRFQPWGAFGGTPGNNGRAVLNPDGDGEQELGRIRVLTMRQGDVLRMTSPSGGGFGDPFERDPAPVLREVADGLLTVDAAARCYGVAIADGAVDATATAALRRGAAGGGHGGDARAGAAAL